MKQGADPARIVALCGGVGGAKLASGLSRIVDGNELVVVVNTGDDFEHFGLSISPDIDSVVYALSGRNDVQRGWGRAAETWHFMDALGELSDEMWFQLGDRDLAMHVLRTLRLRQGAALSEVTADIATRYGIRARVMPMSDDPVRTLVRTSEGTLEFQRYFVARRAEPVVSGFSYEGCERGGLPAAAQRLIANGAPAAVIICPSNPFVSIAPILSIPAWSAWLRAQDAPVIAVSPFVGRQALKGPAAKMMKELGFEASTESLADFYGDLVDAWVIDKVDAADARILEARGIRCCVTDTIMRNGADQVQLAQTALDFAAVLGRAARADDV